MSQRNCVVLLLCVLAFPIIGCSKPTGRIPLTGAVTVEGKPIQGTIQFRPIQAGPVATTSIQKGLFAFTTLNGPFSGEYDVIIETAVTGQKGANADEVLPEKWERSYHVNPESEEAIVFELKSTTANKEAT